MRSRVALYLSHVSTIGTTLLMAGLSPAHAQSTQAGATADQEPSLQEIVVTAQRRQESSQKVPMTVNAFSAADLERFSIAEPKDLQISTPGLTFPQDNGTVNPYIRGRGTNFSGPGLEGSVPIYIDDVYLETQFGVAGLIDVSQVQVLKGPQGTLYGRNATGGAILISTNDPKPEFGGYLEGGYGNLNMGKTQGVLNLPVGDTLALRFSGGYERRDGYVKNVVDGKDHGDLSRYAGRVQALWRPTERFSALFKGEYQFQQNGYLRQLIIDGTGTPTHLGFYETMQSPKNPVSEGGENRAQVWSATSRLAYSAEHWTLTNITGFRDTHLDSCAENDNLYPVLDEFCVVLNQPTASNPHGVGDAYDETLSNELRLATSFASPLNLTFGLSYQHTSAHFPAVIRGSIFGPLVPVFDNWVGVKSYAGYLELYYQLTDRLKFTFGGRFNRDEKSLHVINNDDLAPGFGIPPAFVPSTFSQDASFSDFTPRAVVSYDMGYVNYYFSFNKGFKSGGFNVPALLPQTALRPEKIESYEIGAKIKMLDERARLDLAAFFSKSTDVQVASVDTVSNSVVQQNAATAKAHGVEASFQVAATKSLTLQAGAAYLHSRFTEFPSAAIFSVQNGLLTGDRADLRDFPTTNSPNFTGNGSATYTIRLPSDWATNFTLSGRYSSTYDFSAGAGGPLRADRQKAFGVVNLTGQILSPGGAVTISWYVNNLNGAEYYDQIQTNATWGVYGVQAVPRTYGASVRYSF
jgi:iron complex outermembrane recepter protein